MTATARERGWTARAAIERLDGPDGLDGLDGWAALRWESRRRLLVARAWLGGVVPAALATARSGALADAALLLAQPLRELRRPPRRGARLADAA